jgi:hypothetical protein
MIMKRSSVVVTGLGLLLLGLAAVLSNCGGGGGGGGGVSLQSPAYNLTGNWKETQTLANNGCQAPDIDPVTTNYFSFNQQQGSNTVVATDIATNGTANLTLSGTLLTYSASVDTGGFCTSASQSFSVTFTSASYGSGTQTVSCNKTGGGSCSVTFNEKFEKQ